MNGELVRQLVNVHRHKLLSVTNMHTGLPVELEVIRERCASGGLAKC